MMDADHSPPPKRLRERDPLTTLIASKYSKSSFLEFVKGSILTPWKGVDVTVAGIECAPFQPPSSCEECRKLRIESGLDSPVRVLTWSKLRKPDDIVGLDPRLRILAGAVRGALLHGFTNGMSKALTWKLVDFVTEYWLCPKHQSVIHVSCPGSSEDVGGVVCNTDGFPDLAVLSDLHPTMILLIAENKKVHVPPRTWREEPYDSQIGQCLFYLVAHQLKALTLPMHPPPIMGLFMADGNFCSVVASVDREEGTIIKMKTTEMVSLSEGAIASVLNSIFVLPVSHRVHYLYLTCISPNLIPVSQFINCDLAHASHVIIIMRAFSDE